MLGGEGAGALLHEQDAEAECRGQVLVLVLEANVSEHVVLTESESTSCWRKDQPHCQLLLWRRVASCQSSFRSHSISTNHESGVLLSRGDAGGVENRRPLT